MDTLASILSLVTPGAYSKYTIRVVLEYQFVGNDSFYQFTFLPMGLSGCQRTFTELMKPALAELHQLE